MCVHVRDFDYLVSSTVYIDYILQQTVIIVQCGSSHELLSLKKKMSGMLKEDMFILGITCGLCSYETY